jgi:S-disulfanyl-L-cysteine oxidoreductase SoxD
MFRWVSAHIAGCRGTLAACCARRLHRCAAARVRLVHVAVARLASISSRAALCTLTGLAAVNAAPATSNLGRPATPAEIRAWDIDVRPDFKGLPPGSGSVSKGQDVWEAKCESCHGAFGESNEYFTPIIGHTKPDDVKTGHVAALRAETVPQRTSLMKLSQLSTLWDYINRAMPWNAPKSLSTDDVYAVTAYILNLGNIVPADFVLSDKNIAETQKKLPNRNGTTQTHAMWNVKDKPDLQGATCVTNCAREVTITSRLPDYARNAHGNLAEQNRVIGAIRGADTTVAAASAPLYGAREKVAVRTSVNEVLDPIKLAQKHNCTACHGVTSKILGPSFTDIHKKYGAASATTLAARIKVGGSGVWGSVPMPAQTHVPDADLRAITEWLARGAFP